MTNASAPAARKLPLTGEVHMKDTVALSPKEDGTPREMTILQIATSDDVVRVTDFSKQHEGLAIGDTVRMVIEESNQLDRNERPVTYRNLISASKA